MRAIVQAAAYVPAWTDRGRRVRGPDEDPFSMAASALERVARERRAAEPRWTVRVAGTAPSPAGSGFAELLGGPVDVSEGRPGLAGFEEAVAIALRGTGTEFVVALDLDPDPAGPPSRHVVIPSEGAVAFRIDEFPDGGRPPVDLGHLPSGPYVIPGLFARHRALAPGGRYGWVGDWDTDLRAGRPSGPLATRPPGVPPPRVSEGAYVPRPRYLEGLASRWRFVCDRCSACGNVTFPSRGRCRTCAREDSLEARALPLDGGRVLATTWIGRGGQPTEFDAQVEASGPYGVVIVELEPGVRATLPVADAGPGEIRIDDTVGTRLRRLYPIDGEWRYGRKAVPLASNGPSATAA